MFTLVSIQLHIHRGDGKSALAAIAPSEIIPIEYGGCGPTIASLTSSFSFI